MAVLVGTTTYDTEGDIDTGYVDFDKVGVAAVASGSATKGFFRAPSNSIAIGSGAKTRILVYSADWSTLLGTSDEYSWTTSETDGQLIEVAFSTPVSITASTTYTLALFQGTSWSGYKQLSANGTGRDIGNTYPTAPASVSEEFGWSGFRPTVWLESSDTSIVPHAMAAYAQQ